MNEKINYQKVEGYKLDEQQLACIENDTLSTLVVAGAGTGKTTTIIGKVKWILEKWRAKSFNKKHYQRLPKILLISFTHASKEELKERILREILREKIIFKVFKPGTFLQVETFHSLALKIVRDAASDTNDLGTNHRGGDKLGVRLKESVGNENEPRQNKPILSTVGFGDFLKETIEDNVSSEEEKSKLEEKYAILDRLFGLLRNYHLTIQDLTEQNKLKYHHFWDQEVAVSNQENISLLESLSSIYRDNLKEEGRVDFPSLIEMAIDHIKILRCEGLNQDSKNGRSEEYCYDYVIIDEYQDISPLEYYLVRNLRNLAAFKLFCVGDDWQTIYQFAGSEIDLILNFEKYWGETKRFKIERSYRFPKKLAELSGEFIMQNPKQLTKNICGVNSNEMDQIVEINGPSERVDLDALYYFFLNLPKNASIYFLGRYNFDIRKISHCKFLRAKKPDDMTEMEMCERKDLKIKFMSAHKVKGLQADYVFLINCRDAVLGFPSQMTEHALVELAEEAMIERLQNLETEESKEKNMRRPKKEITKKKYRQKRYAFEEERRLFYVAITRARKKLFLLTVKNKESPFIMELRRNKNLTFYKLE